MKGNSQAQVRRARYISGLTSNLDKTRAALKELDSNRFVGQKAGQANPVVVVSEHRERPKEHMDQDRLMLQIAPNQSHRPPKRI